MLDNRSFYLGATITILIFVFLVVLPKYIGGVYSQYPQITLQMGLYLSSLSLGTMFLSGFREKVTCIWLGIAMLLNYSIYTYQISNAQGPDDYSIASLSGTIFWATLLLSRHQINRRLFFVLGIVPVLRPFARQYLKATPPNLFQKMINYYVATCLLFDVFFTLLWRGLPIYFGTLVEGSLDKTFDAKGWPDLFDVYYDLNNLLVFTLIIFIPSFILVEVLGKRSP